MSHPRRLSLFNRLLSSMSGQRGRKHKRLVSRRLAGTELLETRALLATIIWGNAAGGLWSNGSNWVGGVAPTAADDAVIPDLAGSPTITLNSVASVKSLTIRENFVIAGGTLTSPNIQQLGGSFTLASGTLSGSKLLAGTLTVTGSSTLGTTTIETGTSLIVSPSIPVSISYGSVLTVNGTVDFQTSSTVNFAGIAGFTTRQMIVNGLMRANSATFSGSKFIEFTDSASVDSSNSTFNLSIATSAKHIDGSRQPVVAATIVALEASTLTQVRGPLVPSISARLVRKPPRT